MQQVAHKNTQIKGNLHEKTETLKRGRDEDYPIGEFQAALSILQHLACRDSSVYRGQERWLLGSHPVPGCQQSTAHLVPRLGCQLKDRRTGQCILAAAGGGCHGPASTAPTPPALVAC